MKAFRLSIGLLIIFLGTSLPVIAQQGKILQVKHGYIFSDLPKALIKDLKKLDKKIIQVSLVHPQKAIQRVSGKAFAHGHTIWLKTKHRFGDLPDLINPMILFDSIDDASRLSNYKRVDNHVFWTFMPVGGNPDDITGLPSGPQPYYCGDELCACVLGTTGEETCKGMDKIALGNCRTSDGIKVCCQEAGTSPVDVDGGMTTTCK